jgi:hypothetical protein
MVKLKSSVLTSSVVLALCAGAASASPQIGDTQNAEFLCGQTTHLRMDDGSGATPIAFSVSSAFTLDTTLEYAGVRGGKPSRCDVYVWKLASHSTTGGVANNPLYQGGGSAGNNPLFQASGIHITPINDPPTADTSLELLVELPGTGPSEGDSWSNTRLRVQFLDAKSSVLASYVTDAGIDLYGEESGLALTPGLRTHKSPRAPYPIGRLVAEAGPRNSPPLPTLYFDSLVFTTDLVPTPGASALIGFAGVAALRRRR